MDMDDIEDLLDQMDFDKNCRCFCGAVHLRRDLSGYLLPILTNGVRPVAINRSCWEKYGEPTIQLVLPEAESIVRLRRRLASRCMSVYRQTYVHAWPMDFERWANADQAFFDLRAHWSVWFLIGQTPFATVHKLVQNMADFGEIKTHGPATDCPL